MLAKCEEYHAWGVPFCWVIDLEKQTGWQYHAGNEPERVDRGGTLVAGRLSVPLEDLFSEQPRYRNLTDRSTSSNTGWTFSNCDFGAINTI